MLRELPEIYSGKVVAKNFGKIGHLTGSKMIDNEDVLLSPETQYKFTECKRNPFDDVIITEKIDGMNAGVVKLDNKLYPVCRKGYDVRTISALPELVKSWVDWVLTNYDKLYSAIDEGERLVFENAMLRHTLSYNFKVDPVFFLAKYTPDNKKICYDNLCELAKYYSFNQPPLLCRGIAVKPEEVIKQYPKGLVGSKDGIEGIVYTYEHNSAVEGLAKFVSNPKMLVGHNCKPVFRNIVK